MLRAERERVPAGLVRRDEMVRRMYADEKAMAARVHNLYKEPFEMP